MREGIDVEVREVGLRDGIQGVRTFLPTEAKKAWLADEAAAGVPEIEACSLVPAKLFPQFADAEAVIEAALQHDRLCVSALVPNLKGAERGLALGVPKLNFVLSVSKSHNLANVRRTPEESLEQFRLVASARDEAAKAGPRVLLTGGLATSFGCSIEGPVAEAEVLALVEAYAEAGADEVMLADTVGYANPSQVRRLFAAAARTVGDSARLAGHFHDTRGLGLANVDAALDAGVRRFDASLAGLGGCPAAPGATGNIVMEDLVFMLEAMGLRTGVDLDRLLPIREIIAANLAGEPLHGRFAKAGAPKGFGPTSVAVAAE